MDDEMGGVRRGKTSCHHPFDEPRKSICLVLVTVDHFFLPLFKGFCSARRLQDSSSSRQALCQWGQERTNRIRTSPCLSGAFCYQGHKNGIILVSIIKTKLRYFFFFSVGNFVELRRDPWSWQIHGPRVQFVGSRWKRSWWGSERPARDTTRSLCPSNVRAWRKRDKGNRMEHTPSRRPFFDVLDSQECKRLPRYSHF